MHNNLLLRKPTDSKLYVEDVFSTQLFAGAGTSLTITNGIDLAGKGGLVWEKRRDTGDHHYLYDTARGGTKYLSSNLTNANNAGTSQLVNFLSTGYSTTAGWAWPTGSTVSSWTFRKAPKFFDVVTYTGDGTNNRTISHSLGAVPGMIIVKSTSATGSWYVYHRALPTAQDEYLVLNSTAASVTTGGVAFGAPTSTTFMLEASGGNGRTNATGVSYVAYLFAHDTTADGMIQCGSFSYSGATGASVSLGWEPQFILYKSSTANGGGTNWFIHDNMRGFPVPSATTANLTANGSGAEATGFARGYPTATGFALPSGLGSDDTYVYLAIRRGPMRTPTDATKVYNAQTPAPTGVNDRKYTGVGFPLDTIFLTHRTGGGFGTWVEDRLRGPKKPLYTYSTAAEDGFSQGATQGPASFDQDGWTGGSGDSGQWDYNVGYTNVFHYLRRAPGFFDVVCYTGTGSARTVSHNLGVAPELMIVKGRSLDPSAWRVYASSLGATKFLNLHTTGAATTQSDVWNNTSPTSSVFTVGTDNSVNSSGNTIVAYLFASCSGVSKVGSYTGTGATQTISCGFTGGARFVLIKRADGAASWWVWDTARGMVAGTDPRLALNFTNAEANANWVYTTTGGFQIVTSDTSINASGGTYIYLAIA